MSRFCARSSLLFLLLYVRPAAAQVMTYNDWMSASEVWKRGFVYAVMAQLMGGLPPKTSSEYERAAAYQACLKDTTDATAVTEVNSYLSGHAIKETSSLVVDVRKALEEFCRPTMPVEKY